MLNASYPINNALTNTAKGKQTIVSKSIKMWETQVFVFVKTKNTVFPSFTTSMNICQFPGPIQEINISWSNHTKHSHCMCVIWKPVIHMSGMFGKMHLKEFIGRESEDLCQIKWLMVLIYSVLSGSFKVPVTFV